MTRAEHRQALKLKRYFGAEAGVRRSAAEVARELPPLAQRTPETADQVRAIAAVFKAAGWIEDAPGPRGGAGWRLTDKGARLVAEDHRWKPPELIRAERRAAKEAAFRARHERAYRVTLRRPDGTEETRTVQALDLGEAWERNRFWPSRRAGERIVAIAEAETVA